MTTRELWRSSPDFRRGIRRIAMWGSFGLAAGLLVGMAGNRLPGVWARLWLDGVCAAAAAAWLYMQWDIRRMERERLELMKCIDDATKRLERRIGVIYGPLGEENKRETWLH